MTTKKAILVVSFGTVCRDARERSIGAVEREIAEAYPGWEVRRAFTSTVIIRKLKQRDRIEADTVEAALDRLAKEGFRTVVCQPTHIIGGEEYGDIAEAVANSRDRFAQLRLGAPLLNETGDYRALAKAVGEIHHTAPDTALCLMGHGSAHPADAAYAALDYHFKALGFRNIFVGTVEGFPDLDTLLRQVRREAYREVRLAPLMVVAGDHAHNDMAGGGESWKAAFEAAGYPVTCVMKGLGEYPAIRRMYAEHAGACIAGLAAARQ